MLSNAQPVSYYKKLISKANSAEELQNISYGALKNDPECTAFSKKYNKIVAMCVQKEMSLSSAQGGAA